MKMPMFKEKVLLLTHDNADMDAFCSAAIFQQYLKSKKVRSDIAVPSHINEQALHFAFTEKISFHSNPDIGNYSTIILFDTNDYEQLGRLRKAVKGAQKKGNAEVFSFDHHEIEERSVAKDKKAFVSPEAISTTQVLFDKIGEKEFSKKMCFYACLGIIEDTGHFVTGSVKGFEVFSSCLKKSGKNYSEVLEMSKQKIPPNERIAFIKAAKRSRIKNMDGVVIVYSNLSFYQGQAASKLLGFGADIALVSGTGKHGITSLSGRADNYFRDRKKFNLMKHLMKPLQKKLGGDAGGHSGAAQWKGKERPEKVLKEAIKILEEKLR